MIHFTIQENASTSAVARASAEDGSSFSLDFNPSELLEIPPATNSSNQVEGVSGSRAEIKLPAKDRSERFDWSNKKVLREYIKLEQKCLAKRTDADEKTRYLTMKRDRNSMIFAEKYLRDYAEGRRLKKLAEKLAEIQQYLRPINV